MNQYELQHSWSTHRLLGPSGDAWKPRLRQTLHSAVDVLACTVYVSATLQAFLDWLQVSQIHLRATNLSIHWLREDWEATKHKPALLSTAAADKMQAFRTFWLLFGWLSMQWTLLWVKSSIMPLGCCIWIESTCTEKENLYAQPWWSF